MLSRLLKNMEWKVVTPIGTPIGERTKLDSDILVKLVNKTKYQSMIGSLMYLTYSRPDIVFFVCYCARYQAYPTEGHLKEVKRIFRYIKGTLNIGFWYAMDSGILLIAYSNANHAGCEDTFKRTSHF